MNEVAYSGLGSKKNSYSGQVEMMNFGLKLFAAMALLSAISLAQALVASLTRVDRQTGKR
ncbi:MAG TPA: hypothetical protein VFJ27_08765 [Terriglobia bacterium]|nr:hypothetical protein [Terriglobia bacterium]